MGWDDALDVWAVLVVAAYAFAFTYAALWLIRKIMPVAVSKEEQQTGVDEALHEESAYEAGAML